MATNYHHHDYGVGRLLSRWYWGFIIVMALWVVVVFLMTFPWIFIIGCSIVGACVLIAPHTSGRRVNAKPKGKHGA